MSDNATAQPFERYPALAAQIMRMASTGTVGSLNDWQNFTDALNAALSEAAWQDISTAPSNGKWVLAVGGRYEEATLTEADGEWWRRMAREGNTAVPTHWMHRPIPPVTRHNREGGAA